MVQPLVESLARCFFSAQLNKTHAMLVAILLLVGRSDTRFDCSTRARCLKANAGFR